MEIAESKNITPALNLWLSILAQSGNIILRLLNKRIKYLEENASF